MAIEFNLLYRWHGLIPTEFHVAGTDEPIWRTVFNRSGWPSTAWRGWSITPRAGAPADRAAQHRAGAARGGAQQHPSGPRVTAFDQISSDPELQAGLPDLCRDVDRIELYTGLFVEDTRPNSVLPALIGRLVAVDAFSQALANPLLSPRVFTRRRSRRSGWRSSAPRPRCRTSCTATSRRARGATSSP